MRKIIPLLLLILSITSACSSLDCSMNNTVFANFKMRGDVDTLKDTLTIWTHRTDGSDSVLINQDVNKDSVLLPLSYLQNKDIFYFRVANIDREVYLDTVTVSKTNHPHFESVDCSPAYFHTLTGVEYTTNAIDSIRINYNSVTYDASKRHFYIYFKDIN